MKRGAWHQFGDRSQRLALDELAEGAGEGVIISPRDLSFSKAKEYAPQYIDAGADILVDQQFYIPESTVGHLEDYPTGDDRDTISRLNRFTNTKLTQLASHLRIINSELNASAVLAPSVIYEAGRPDIEELNAKLFSAARVAANDLGLPCYATIVLGQSITAADSTTNSALSSATALQADGWYFAFEFNADRVPSSYSLILRYLEAGLSLACTGKPVLHGFVGPLAPLAMACGATAVGIGHSQNLWQIIRSRWQPTEPGGGGGDAPPRYFSREIWGTLIYEDEYALLSQDLRGRVHTPTPFSTEVGVSPPFLPWDRWNANKHLVYVICDFVHDLCVHTDVESVLDASVALLNDAVQLHSNIEHSGIHLGDNTSSYHTAWLRALTDVKTAQTDDFEFLRLLT